MSKTMCELNKKDQAEKSAEPRFQCKKCGSVAHREKHLCKPKKIKDNNTEE